jgi:hypothetical protein
MIALAEGRKHPTGRTRSVPPGPGLHRDGGVHHAGHARRLFLLGVREGGVNCTPEVGHLTEQEIQHGAETDPR